MTVGILGGGQLARMLGLAGIPLGLRFNVFDPAANVCGGAIGTHIRAGYDNSEALQAFANSVDMVTYEFENVAIHAVECVEESRVVHPNKKALFATQDRLREKELFKKLGIPTVDFVAVDSADQVRAAGESLGYPLVLKSRSGGYDGKGQVIVRSAEDVDAAWAETAGRHVIAEGFVAFDREVSMVAARRPSGETVFYDIAENSHSDGILRVSLNRPDDPAAGQARGHVQKLLEALDYYGVIALELFDVGGTLLANEYAPRVHNTGHWTIDGAVCSQFENHLRAILDWPLGDTASKGHCAMINFIGDIPSAESCLAIPDAHYHAYDKAPRPGRKVGHITVCAPDAATLAERINRVEALLVSA